MNPTLKAFLSNGLKGFAMGAANIIPGVSGGTIAVITGIYEKLLNSVKSIDIVALKLILKGDFKGFADRINLLFLAAIGIGSALSIVTLAKLFEILLVDHKLYLWSFFFGLILASVYFLAKTISKITIGNIAIFIIGTAIALWISLLTPASENDGAIYLIVCGVVAICSMILPGLSGSYVLILLGNYQLIIIDAISHINLRVIALVGTGCVIGILTFSHLLSWLFAKFKDLTISLLSGFILGSLLILWPWKNDVYLMDEAGELILKKGEPIQSTYEWFIPASFNTEVIIAVALMIAGIATIYLMDKVSANETT
ncbi:MAG: DUF368 domain-containing protein [Flavobacteriales bacterium]|nr:DUF368 domain-containing protein [Flavobacteriales bacterium]